MDVRWDILTLESIAPQDPIQIIVLKTEMFYEEKVIETEKAILFRFEKR
jgi:hypothetical protein